MNRLEYTTYQNVTKDFKMSDDFLKAKEPYKEDFEKIYEKVKEEEIHLTNAKEFLKSLNKEEIKTLQGYAGLEKEIELGTLSHEAAYNLLLKHYEKFDFNSDGILEDGNLHTSFINTSELTRTQQKAFRESLGEMTTQEGHMVNVVSSLPKIFKEENGEISLKSGEGLNYNDLMLMMSRITSPSPLVYTSEDIRGIISRFRELFDQKLEEHKSLEESHFVAINSVTNNVKAVILADEK